MRRIFYLLQRWKLLFQDVQSLQQLPLFQYVVFWQVERRVQQMHDMFHVLQSHGMLAGRRHCSRGYSKVDEDEKVKWNVSGVMPGEIITAIYQQAWVVITKQAKLEPFMTAEKCVCTLFRRADVINCIIDDELEVLVQQSIDQRRGGYTLSIC